MRILCFVRFNHKVHRKDVLLISRHYRSICRYSCTNRELGICFLNNPFADFIGLLRYCRIIRTAYRKAIIDVYVDSLKRSSVFV